MSPVHRFFALALVALVGVVGLVLAGSDFMVMLPALSFLLPLLCGRYLGERSLARVRRSLVARRLRAANRTISATKRRGHGLLVRGGRLLAVSLAVRPPPFTV